jgi:hypothetical protein
MSPLLSKVPSIKSENDKEGLNPEVLKEYLSYLLVSQVELIETVAQNENKVKFILQILQIKNDFK